MMLAINLKTSDAFDEKCDDIYGWTKSIYVKVKCHEFCIRQYCFNIDSYNFIFRPQMFLENSKYPIYLKQLQAICDIYTSLPSQFNTQA